jgi:hypothetical protein
MGHISYDADNLLGESINNILKNTEGSLGRGWSKSEHKEN